MPALITHHLFGEESIDRLPLDTITSEDERAAFLIANQGPDPFFFHVRSLNAKNCMELGRSMHRCRTTRQFQALHDGVRHLHHHDAGVGRAFALGLLSHYALDRVAHPFVYAQQWGIQEVDPSLDAAGSQIHGIIEADLDVLMLQLKRDGATTADYPPESELVTTARINKVAGALMSYVAYAAFDITLGGQEYGGSVADMQLAYKLIEPAGTARSEGISMIESVVRPHSLLGALAHRVTTQVPAGAANGALEVLQVDETAADDGKPGGVCPVGGVHGDAPHEVGFSPVGVQLTELHAVVVYDGGGTRTIIYRCIRAGDLPVRAEAEEGSAGDVG